MKAQQSLQGDVRVLFLDVGGVLLTNTNDGIIMPADTPKHFTLEFGGDGAAAWLEPRNP